MIMTMYSTNPIMNVAEARKIMGEEAEKYTNGQILKIIDDLDFIAKMTIDDVKKKLLEPDK